MRFKDDELVDLVTLFREDRFKQSGIIFCEDGPVTFLFSEKGQAQPKALMAVGPGVSAGN